MKLSTCMCLGLVISSIKAWPPSSRLQRDSIPTSYSLKLIPDIETDTFKGEVTILIKIQESLNKITLNSKFLNITEITLDQAFGETGVKLDPERELLHVFYKDISYIDPGEHMLNIKFNGSLQRSFGFYSIKLKNNGTILATKFSTIHAREAFPCFDEPHFKSIFTIRLVKPEHSWTALSNMEEIGQLITPEGTSVDFRSTIPMSTYLLAWSMMDFSYDEIMFQRQKTRIPLRFFTLEDETLQRKEALRVTKEALTFFENYTGIPYPLSKLDSIEIPYYRSLGMEHWGLVVYHSHSVMYEPSFSTSKLYHRIEATQLITHEISHMWFGNLVSHEWYNDLWLTEGFARMMQYKASHTIIGAPFLKMLFQFNKFSNLFRKHCNYGSLTETAGYSRSLNDIGKKFGSNTYDQGGAILLMLEDVIGPEKFREAVQNHLMAHKYKYATTGDFINTVQDVVPNVNIRNFMETYLFQNNLPLITVTQHDDYYILKQKPFCGDRNSSVFRNRWTIPINYIISANKSYGKVWLDRDMLNVTIPKPNNNSWIIVNHLNKGLYRTLYTSKIYAEIRKGFKELPIENRGVLLEETFLLESTGKLFCDIPLQFFGEMRTVEEVDFLTFEYARRSFFDFTKTHSFEQDVIDILESYFVYVFEPLYHNVSWMVEENEPMDHRLLRQRVLQSFCLDDLLWMDCYRDVQNVIANHLTVHDDVKNIYEKSLERMKLNNLLIIEKDAKVSQVTTTYYSGKQMNENGQKCSIWIRENLPKIMGETRTR